MNKIRVLIVDDSAVFRAAFSHILSSDEEIEVIGTASDAYEARDLICKLRPDVITLDIEMPKMNGVEFLKKLIPQYPLPVVVCSSLAYNTFSALDAGAVEFICKPHQLNSDMAMSAFSKNLTDAVKTAKQAKVIQAGSKQFEVVKHALEYSSSNNTNKIIAIAGSTGSTEALPYILSSMNLHTPPVVITIHMPEGYTSIYAKRLNEQMRIVVAEARDGMYLEKGMAVIAQGNHHLQVYRDSRGYFISSEVGEKVSGHSPSADVMFSSVAYCAGDKAIGCILTGMGSDGAKGLLEMKKAGAYTIGQNDESCLVYGMPKVAKEMGAVVKELPLEKISYEIYKRLKGM